MSKKTKQITEVPRQQSWNNAPADYTPVDEAKLAEMIEVAERITNLFQSGQYGQVINASREVKKRFAALQFGMDNESNLLADPQHKLAAVSFFNRCYGDVSQIVEASSELLKAVQIIPRRGPIPPNKFCWDGKTVLLAPTQWTIAKVLWENETPTIQFVMDEVWGKETSDSNFQSQLSKLTTRLFGLDMKFDWRVKSGHVYRHQF